MDRILVQSGRIYKLVPEGHEEKEDGGVTLLVDEDGTALMTEFHEGAVVAANEVTLV